MLVQDHEKNNFLTVGHSQKYLKATALEMLTHVHNRMFIAASSVILKTRSDLIIYQAI